MKSLLLQVDSLDPCHQLLDFSSYHSNAVSEVSAVTLVHRSSAKSVGSLQSAAAASFFARFSKTKYPLFDIINENTFVEK